MVAGRAELNRPFSISFIPLSPFGLESVQIDSVSDKFRSGYNVHAQERSVHAERRLPPLNDGKLTVRS